MARVLNRSPRKRHDMNLHTTRAALVVALLATGWSLSQATAQVIDFTKIDAFELMGTETLHGGSPPKAIINDGEQHTVFLTIWESDIDTKAYWQSLDGKEARTTTIHGQAVQAFQTDGELKLEALGEENQTVKYGYVLLRLKKQ